MKLKQATLADFESVLAFYGDVMDRTPEIGRYARWLKGKHPTSEGIRTFIEEGSLYLRREKGIIIGAMALSMHQSEEYHAIAWSLNASDDEVAVIHLLAVSPDYQSTGIGSEMVLEAIQLAHNQGMKAIRLDALASNTPAHRLYKRLGFVNRGVQHLYAENTGRTDFYFFEYNDDTSGLRDVEL